MESEILVLNYNISGGFAGWTMLTIKYNSNTRELYKYVRKPVYIAKYRMESVSEELVPNAKSGENQTRILTQEEDKKLKSEIASSGYMESNEKPIDDNSTTEGYYYVLDVTQGQHTRNVSWYEGVGGSATIPKPIQNILSIITNV
jgi:hypothetical protein